MKSIVFYFDFVSPQAFLAFEQLPCALMGCSYTVTYKPVLLAALLRQNHQPDLAKTTRRARVQPRSCDHALRQAQQLGIAMQMPAAYPFNPLALLRLAVVSSRAQAGGAPSRYVCETIFRHVWQSGAAADDALRLQALTQRLAPAQAIGDAAVKAGLRAQTQEALAQGVSGVPTLVMGSQLFGGLDALTALRAQVLDAAAVL